MSIEEIILSLERTIKEHEYNSSILGKLTISSFELESLKLELRYFQKKQEKLANQTKDKPLESLN